MPSFLIVDSHVHLYDPGLLNYPWMADHPRLLSPHRMPDFDRARGAVEVDRVVFVEVDVDPALRDAEAEWVAQQAEAEPRIGAMVASAPLERGAAVEEIIERLARHESLRGIRRLLQSEPDPEFCLQPGFVEGVRLLARYGLSFDICIRHHQLDSATRLVQLCPDVSFVLDHIAKPAIKDNLFEPWRTHLRELASLPNVTCKISGVLTEADHENWSRDEVRPYIEHAIACFGFDRVMFGGDWPVLTLAGGYESWVAIVDWILEGCTVQERRALFRDTAIRTYRLEEGGSPGFTDRRI